MTSETAIKYDIYFSGTDFFMEAEDIEADLFSALLDCGGPGDGDGAVDYVLSAFTIGGEVEACRLYLKGYGAWDDEELADHEMNIRRLTWLAGCSLYEREPVVFSTY